MAKLRAMVVRKRGGPLEAEERDIPVPGPEEIRIRVHACDKAQEAYDRMISGKARFRVVLKMDAEIDDLPIRKP